MDQQAFRRHRRRSRYRVHAHQHLRADPRPRAGENRRGSRVARLAAARRPRRVGRRSSRSGHALRHAQRERRPRSPRRHPARRPRAPVRHADRRGDGRARLRPVLPEARRPRVRRGIAQIGNAFGLAATPAQRRATRLRRPGRGLAAADPGAPGRRARFPRPQRLAGRGLPAHGRPRAPRRARSAAAARLPQRERLAAAQSDPAAPSAALARIGGAAL